MKVAIQPIGKVPESISSGLRDALGSRGLSSEVLAPVAIPLNAFNPVERRYDAKAILDAVEAVVSDLAIVVTSEDMFVPGMKYIFGYANVGGRTAVVSVHRLGGEREPRTILRLVKESVHELGHTWGLGHCFTEGCVMRFSNTLEESDAKGDAFCETCLSDLPEAARSLFSRAP